PFADDCERRENGMITAGGEGPGLDGLPRQGCRGQMFTRVFTYIDSIDLRRVWIADEVTGLVFRRSQFRHSMEDRVLDVCGLHRRPRHGCRDAMFTRVFPSIDSSDLRRVWIADAVTGLVFGLSQFRHSMEDRVLDVYGRDGELTTREVNFDPFDLPAMHVFKI